MLSLSKHGPNQEKALAVGPPFDRLRTNGCTDLIYTVSFSCSAWECTPWTLLRPIGNVETMEKMILKSPYEPHEVIQILREEVDKSPSLLRCIVTLNTHYYSGTSDVCGVASESGFELRNRSVPVFSLRAIGILSDIKDGTEIQINFSKPMFPGIVSAIFPKRYQYDQEKIVGFLKHYLRAKEKAEQ